MSASKRIPVAGKFVGYDYDAAFPTLLKNLLVPGSGILGFVLAAIFGAVVSSLASMLNSASTIFTMDIYYKLRKGASQGELVTVGRICTVVFVLIALLIAPNLGQPQVWKHFQLHPRVSGLHLAGCVGHISLRIASASCPSLRGNSWTRSKSHPLWFIEMGLSRNCVLEPHGDLLWCDLGCLGNHDQTQPVAPTG